MKCITGFRLAAPSKEESSEEISFTSVPEKLPLKW